MRLLRNPEPIYAQAHENSTAHCGNVNIPLLSKNMLFDVLAVYDIGCIISSAVVAYYLYIVLILHTSANVLSYMQIVSFVAIIFHTIARQSGQYRFRSPFSFSSQLSTLIYISAKTIAVTFAILFFLKVSAEFSRMWLLSWAILLLLLLTAGRAMLAYYLDGLIRKGALSRSIALVGCGTQFELARCALLLDKHHFNLVATLDLSTSAAPSKADGSLLDYTTSAGGVHSFIADARDMHASEVIIALPSARGEELEKIVRRVQMLPVDVHVIPDFGGTNITGMHIQQIAGLSLITTVSKPLSEWSAFSKIIEDYIIGILCLILFAPAMALIAIAIKLDSKGPVLFRQRRHGYNHQVIEVLKFRSMTVMEDGDTIRQATKKDKRVTGVGAFLRRTSLDELPQFWNIVRGEMSVVGPRPHALAHNTYYGDLVEDYANRHRVKPGLTGWAQVHGFRGETSAPGMMEKRVQYDLEYIENWSLWLDLKILIMTPLFGLFRRSAY
ncbi:MAG: undecaprenyl-phosphate glucose phosphotransferase [Rhodomicrobium sp.]